MGYSQKITLCYLNLKLFLVVRFLINYFNMSSYSTNAPPHIVQQRLKDIIEEQESKMKQMETEINLIKNKLIKKDEKIKLFIEELNLKNKMIKLLHEELEIKTKINKIND